MLFRTGFVGRQVVGSSGSSTAPSLSLDFTRPGVLDPRVVFTRASSGTYFDSGGVMQTAGLNLSTNSQALSLWPTKGDTTITDNSIVSPDGTTNASLLTTGSAGNDSTSNTAATVAAGSTLTFSCFAKRGNFDWLHLFGSDIGTANGVQTWVNLATGAVSNTAVLGTATAPNVVVTTLGNGWYRIAATVTMPGTSTTAFLMFRTAASAGSGTRFLNGQYYVWGCQVELGPVATQYAPTTTVANSSPRWDYDPVSLQLRGLLLEDQRTNGIRNSSATGVVPGTPGTLPTNWALNMGTLGLSSSVIGTGVENGITYFDWRIFGTAATGGSLQLATEASTAIAALTGQAWTNSYYWKLSAGTLNGVTVWQSTIRENTSGGVLVRDNLANVSAPTTAALSGQRATQTATLSGGGTTAFIAQRWIIGVVNGAAIDFTLRIGGTQLEQGDFATSFIPTTSSAVTRSIDSCLIPPANMPPWFAPPGGSWFAEFDYFDSTPVNSRVIARANGVSASTAVTVNPAQAVLQYDGTVVLATANSGAANTTMRAASTWAPGQAKICLNGGAVASAANLATGYGVFATFGVGFMSCSVALNTDNTSGHLRRVQYYPRVLADAEMQTLTTITDPSLFLNFMNPNTLDPRIAFARASTATYTDVNGVMQTANNDTPRWDYDPVTHALRGLLLEEARTNGIRNSSDMSGAITGTPGTPPTNWSYNGGSAGLTWQTVGSGIENGISYLDIRWFGTAAAGGNILISEGTTGIVAATGQVWTGSLYWRVVAGDPSSMTTSQFVIREMTSTGVFVKDNPINVANPTTALVNTQRVSNTTTLSGGGTVARVQARHINNFNAGPVDVTIRYAGPQIEQGAFPTSFIPTTGSAVTRVADGCTIPSANMTPWFATTGSWAVEFITINPAPNNNRIIGAPTSGTGGITPMTISTPPYPIGSYDGSNFLASLNFVTPNVVQKGAQASAGPGGVLKLCLNAGAIRTSNHVTGFGSLATSGLRFMTTSTGVVTENGYGYVRAAYFWPRVLSDAEMQQVTT